MSLVWLIITLLRKVDKFGKNRFAATKKNPKRIDAWGAKMLLPQTRLLKIGRQGVGDTVPPDWPIKRLSNCVAHYLNAFCTLIFIHIVWLTLSAAFMPARTTLAANRTTQKKPSHWVGRRPALSRQKARFSL
jgi:hypothetical protein